MSESLVTVTFVNPDSTRVSFEAKVGTSVMQVAHDNNVAIPALCEGSLACSTCHVIVDDNWFDKLDKASDDEEDMLDLAFGLKPTSRLSCQVFLTPELDGLVVYLPQK